MYTGSEGQVDIFWLVYGRAEMRVSLSGGQSCVFMTGSYLLLAFLALADAHFSWTTFEMEEDAIGTSGEVAMEVRIVRPQEVYHSDEVCLQSSLVKDRAAFLLSDVPHTAGIYWIFIADVVLWWKPLHEPSFNVHTTHMVATILCGFIGTDMRCEGLGSFTPVMQLVNSEAGPDMSVLGVLSHPPAIMPMEMTWLAEIMCCVLAAPGVATVAIALSPDLSWPQNFHGNLCCFSTVWCTPAQSSIVRERAGRLRKESPSQCSLCQFWGLEGQQGSSWSVFTPWRFPVEWEWHFLV